jgi:hypothetical protein
VRRLIRSFVRSLRSKTEFSQLPNCRMPPSAKKPNSADAAAATDTATATYEYTIDRYYYTPQRRFEQSLDVYKPVVRNSNIIPKTNDDNDSKQQPQHQHQPTPQNLPVVLVMGSGWLGHKPYFYVMTNWWNSSAPKQICGRLGPPCLSIRHSGGYLFGRKKGHSSSLFLGLWTLSLVVVAVMWQSSSSPSPQVVAMVPFLLLMALLSLLYKEGMGAAGIEDMVTDVSTALNYIDVHAHEWGLGGTAPVAIGTETKDREKIPVIFGGYSSGAHVAATLLTASTLSPLQVSSMPSVVDDNDDGARNPSLLQPKQGQQSQRLEYLTIRFVLYISGVLDVSPESFVMTMLSRVVLGKAPSQVPSPLRTLLLSVPIKSESIGKRNGAINDNHDVLPMLSLPPHMLIGCKREVFGWAIMESAFCASEYADALWSHVSESKRRQGQAPTSEIDGDGGDIGDNNNDNDMDEKNAFVQLILLDGWGVNHWSILSSMALRNTLRTVLASCGDNRG